RRNLAIGLVSLAACSASYAGDWLQFRGTNGTGASPADPVPTEFDAVKMTNLAWKVELPGRGLSSPIVVGDKVFLTACSGRSQDELQVLGFDAGTGKKLWQRTIWATGPTDAHPVTNMAAPTPASDGKYIVSLFATNDLICVDLEGSVQWIRSL